MGRYSTRRGREPTNARWVVEHGGLKIECRDEADAKRLAARLRKKGYRVTARTGFDASPLRPVPQVLAIVGASMSGAKRHWGYSPSGRRPSMVGPDVFAYPEPIFALLGLEGPSSRSSSRIALACFKSNVSKPSVNQP
jgi:hypothetical protein